ncbi:uncharacterized mitochondrial protein-like protein [Tanacetum coccineum]
METCDPIGTPMDIKYKLDLDKNGTLVDATKYRSMIGALMYLTSSRLDIVNATYLCAWYQAKPTEKHLKEAKRWSAGPQRNKIVHRCQLRTQNMCLYPPVVPNQHQRDLPRDTPLDRVDFLRTSKYGESNAIALEDPTLRAGNPVKEVLLKLNLPDHMYSIIYCKMILTEPEVNVTKL